MSEDRRGLEAEYRRLIDNLESRDQIEVVLSRSDNPKRGLSDRRLHDRSGPMRCQDAGTRAAGAFGLPAASLKESRA